MMGQETYQIMGKAIEKERSQELTISEDDIHIVMEQTNASKEKAKKAISDNNGDLAAAILSLK
jgi:nascent polypeptide-associated complex subunit alpha